MRRNVKLPKFKMHVLMKKGMDKLAVLMKTMTRKEAMNALLTVGGKTKKTAKKKKELAAKEQKQNNVKIILIKKTDKKKDEEDMKIKKTKKNKPSLKNKPCAKTKPSLKNKPSAVKKNEWKAIKKNMQGAEGVFGGGKWKQFEEDVEDKR